jgi:hypothetical protein
VSICILQDTQWTIDANIYDIEPSQRAHLDVPQTPKAPSPSWSAPKLDGIPALGSWSSHLSLRSLTLDEARLSGSPGPTEISGEAPAYDDLVNDREDVTALPTYYR